MAGPSITPRHILENRGSWRAKVRSDELQLPTGVPTAPDILDDEGRAEWERLTSALAEADCIAVVDRSMLAVYCSTWSDFVRLTKLLADPAIDEKVAWQLTVARGKAADLLVKIAGQFGFSPASRTTVTMSPPARTGVSLMARNRNPLDDFKL